MKYSEKYWDYVKKSVSSIPTPDKLRGKTILVTGATGMICSAVVDVLLYLNNHEDAEIRILVAGRDRKRTLGRFDVKLECGSLKYVPFDATTRDAVVTEASVDYIIHGASNANPAIYMKEPAETILANVLGLQTMLNLAVEKKATRLMYVSSSEVYGQKEVFDPYGEEDYGFIDVLNARSGYPLSKRTGESLCIAYGAEYGVDAVIVRPGHIYGPTILNSDNRASAEFTRMACSGSNIVMNSAGTQLRSYCFILDCATAMLTVLLEGENGNAYNISNPDSICSIRNIAEAIAGEAGVKVEFSAASEEERKSYNPMSNSSLKSEKLERLGWKPGFPLAEGVKATIECYK